MNRHVSFLASWLAATLLLCLAARSPAVEVEAEGKAPGNVANAREQALADALREAIRKGVGVDILSQTKVTDFVLDYDRITAAAFGHVKDYQVLSSRLGVDEIYRVKIKADVSHGTPGMKDVLALRQIVSLKKSPRVALEMDELIEGVPAGSDFAKAWFESAARDMQLNLVDTKRTTRQSDRLAARDQLVGDKQTAEIRRAGIAQDADFILQVKLRGRHVGSRVLRGTPVQVFSLSADLRALRPDTGQVLVSIPMPTEEVPSRNQAVDGAARQLVHAMLEGDVSRGASGAWTLFRKVLANWIVEVDVGAITRLEFAKITDTEFDRLQKMLAETSKISAVWPREFDSKALSYVDVETRLDATGLKSEVLKLLEGKFMFERATTHYLQFVRAPQANPQKQNIAPPQEPVPPAAPSKESSAPVVAASTIAANSAPPAWPWALGGLGAVAMLAVGFFLGKRTPQSNRR